MKQKTVLEWYHVLMFSIVVLIPLYACISMIPWLYVDYDRAHQALFLDGNKDIRLLGYTPYGCFDNTPIHTKFSATDPYDMKVTGVVCSTRRDGSVVVYDQY